MVSDEVEKDISAPLKPSIYVYLDQRVLSELREYKDLRPHLSERIEHLRSLGAVFVISHTSLLECHESCRPMEFARVLESLSVKLLAPVPKNLIQRSLEEIDPVDLLAGEGVSDLAGLKAMEAFLQPMQFTSGWLKNSSSKAVQESVLQEVQGSISELLPNVPDILKSSIRDAHDHFLRVDLDSALQEELNSRETLRAKLPANYAQLDELPPLEAAELIVNSLSSQEMQIIRREYPKGFRKTQPRQGDLVGFAFLLYSCGLVRDKRVKGAGPKGRQHYKGQFRDCCHIEEAAYCDMMLTFDKGLQRLSNAVYSYAGVATQVGLVSVKK